MHIEKMTFSNNDGDVEPETVTVTMTVREALWIALVSGKQRGSSPHSGIFSCLTNNVFNRYWEDGAEDAQKQMRVEIPPIRYSEQR